VILVGVDMCSPQMCLLDSVWNKPDFVHKSMLGLANRSSYWRYRLCVRHKMCGRVEQTMVSREAQVHDNYNAVRHGSYRYTFILMRCT
jgi:hypothetical protein